MVDIFFYVVNLLVFVEVFKGGFGCLGRKELLGLRSLFKLEYKVGIGVQSLVSVERFSFFQQKNDNLEFRYKLVVRVSLYRKRLEVEVRLSGLEIVNLIDGVSDLCDQDLEVQVVFVNVIVFGLGLGGIAERVIDFFLVIWDLSECCMNEYGECYKVQGNFLERKGNVWRIIF